MIFLNQATSWSSGICCIRQYLRSSIRGAMKDQKLFNLFNSWDTCRILMSRRIIVERFTITIPTKLFEPLCIILVFQHLRFKLGYVFSTQIYFTSLVSGSLSFTPGGFVITEGSMLELLAKGGNSIATATASVLLVRLNTIWFATIWFATIRFATIWGLIAIRLIEKRRLESVELNQKCDPEKPKIIYTE
jgi:uncharacterized membrane protein YbhN (UPF0104 family)